MAAALNHEKRFYGRRRGQTLSLRQKRLLSDVLPGVSIPLENIAAGALDPKTLFDFLAEDIWLEIGFGKGEHLGLQAGGNPGVGFISAEPFINGVAGLVTKIHERDLKNIRIYADDARHLLRALRPQSIGRLFLLHPDPWPKARHAKRRFVCDENLTALSRVMKPGAELRISTDHPGHMAWTMIQMQKCQDFFWTAERAEDWRRPPADWFDTRYAAKARASHRPSAYFTFVRV